MITNVEELLKEYNYIIIIVGFISSIFSIISSLFVFYGIPKIRNNLNKNLHNNEAFIKYNKIRNSLVKKLNIISQNKNLLLYNNNEIFDILVRITDLFKYDKSKFSKERYTLANKILEHYRKNSYITDNHLDQIKPKIYELIALLKIKYKYYSKEIK